MNALPPLITQHLDEVLALCEKYRVKRLTLFGSAVKGTFDEETSDLDFAVEFHPADDPLVRGARFLDLLTDLRVLFNKEVDLVSVWAIRNPYFKQVLELTEHPLYEAA
jgi:predicted nucleotidyltransferase